MSPRLLQSWSRPAEPALDMGQGQRLSAADLLDGHFRRITTGPATRTVQVQIDDQLRAAITVLAPELSPLTHLAEELVEVVHDVRPEPQFRADLHRALEQTHRQHAAQRTLGTRPSGTLASTPPLQLKYLAIFIFLLSLTMLWLSHRRRSRGAS